MLGGRIEVGADTVAERHVAQHRRERGRVERNSACATVEHAQRAVVPLEGSEVAAHGDIAVVKGDSDASRLHGAAGEASNVVGIDSEQRCDPAVGADG